MRTLLLLLLMTLPLGSLAQTSADESRAKEEALSPKPQYTAYWLLEMKPGERNYYQRLLIVQQPIERLANLDFPPRGHSATRESSTALPFDHWAFTFDTYGKDSLWSDPFACVKRFGEYDKEAKSLEVNGLKSRLEDCSLEDVVRLLENPLGKQKLHRMAHPLSGAELTARAFVMLLNEQMAESAKSK